MADPRHRHRSGITTLSVLALVGLIGLGLGLMWGSEGWEPWWRDEQALAMLSLRWPRSVGAWLAGACLALAGIQAQTLFRNPLADPYVLGSATGAGLGVALVLWAAPLGWVGAATWTPVLGGFVGAWLALGLVILLVRSRVRDGTLIMAGMVVSVLLGSSLALLLRSNPHLMPAMQGFMLGQTLYLQSQDVVQLGLVLVFALAVSWWWAPALDALSLGESVAQSMGVRVMHTRVLYLGLLSLLTATAVAHLGLVAFVGWIAPHLAKRGLPRGLRWRMPGAALAGGLVLCSADGLARALVAPQEWPVGILTAWLGGLWMLWQLRHTRLGVRHG